MSGPFPYLVPITGFKETEWAFVVPGGYEDPETGEWVPGGEPGYLKRYIRANAFPGAPDGKTGAADSMFISLSDLEHNPEPEAIASLIQAQRDICEASLRDLFERRGVPFPDALGK
jgi:hypothetical protein